MIDIQRVSEHQITAREALARRIIQCKPDASEEDKGFFQTCQSWPRLIIYAYVYDGYVIGYTSVEPLRFGEVKVLLSRPAAQDTVWTETAPS